MRFDKTEISLAAVAIACVLFGFVSPGWLIFLLTIAFAKALVVQGVVMQMRSGLVSFGQGLFYCIGGYTVGMGGQFFGIHDAIAALSLGILVAIAVAMVLGLLLTRYRDIFFAMLSLAFSMILFGILVKSPELGSTDGFNVHNWTIFGWSPEGGESSQQTVFTLTVRSGHCRSDPSLHQGRDRRDLRSRSRKRSPRGISWSFAALVAVWQLCLCGCGFRTWWRVDCPCHRACRSGNGLLDHIGRIHLYRTSGRAGSCRRTVHCRRGFLGGADLCHRTGSPYLADEALPFWVSSCSCPKASGAWYRVRNQENVHDCHS